MAYFNDTFKEQRTSEKKTFYFLEGKALSFYA